MKAFPTNKTLMLQDDNEKMYLQSIENLGMDLRDYFAAKAMQGFLTEDCDVILDSLAHDSYKVADAMMRARDA